MSATNQITVTSTSPTAIVAASNCKKIKVMEHAGVSGWPTSDFLVYKGSLSATPIRKPGGTEYVFDRAEGAPYGCFEPNSIVGWIKTVAGTTTFDQDESASI